MEDIIQFLITIGVLFIGFAVQNKKNKKKRRQSTEEVFPPIFDYKNEKTKKEDTRQPIVPHASSIPLSVEVSQETSIDQAIRRSQASSPQRQAAGKRPLPLKSEATRINLHSSQKAREAFIHSEIFTRKYK